MSIYTDKIEELLDEMTSYSEVVNKTNGSRDDRAKNLQKLFEKNKDAEEVKDFAFDAFFMASFQNLDLQIIRAKFVSYVELYISDPDSEPLSDKVMEAYNYLKTKLPKRMFVVKQGEFIEVESGSISKKREMFNKQNLFDMVEQQLNSVLKNVPKGR